MLFLPPDIRRRYMLGWFAVDVVSALPLELMLMLGGSDGGDAVAATRLAKTLKLMKLVRVFRLFRLLRIQRILDRLEARQREGGRER